jgi:hypothetical protein
VRSAQAQRFELTPSASYAALLVGLHGIAAACFLTVMTGWPGILLAAASLALGAAAAWDRALLRGAHSPRSIDILPTGEARCRFADGETAGLRSSGGVTRFWVPLRVRATARRSLLVTAGMLPQDAFRHLRLWALWRGTADVAPGQLRA